MKDVKVAIPTQNMRVGATGGKTKNSSSKTQRWQFRVRISGVFFMGICNFGNLIGPPNPPPHPWDVRVPRRENFAGFHPRECAWSRGGKILGTTNVIYFFCFAEVVGSSCVKRDFLCNQEKNTHNDNTLPLTNSSPLKIGTWETILSFLGWRIFRGVLLVSGRVNQRNF